MSDTDDKQRILNDMANLEAWATKAKMTDVYLQKPDGTIVLMNMYDKSERPIPEYVDYGDDEL